MKMWPVEDCLIDAPPPVPVTYCMHVRSMGYRGLVKASLPSLVYRSSGTDLGSDLRDVLDLRT